MFQEEKIELSRSGRMTTFFKIYIYLLRFGMSLTIQMVTYLLLVLTGLSALLLQSKVEELNQM